MEEALCDDLHTSRGLSILLKNLDSIQSSKEQLVDVKSFLVNFLGLTLAEVKAVTVEITPEIKKLLAEREDARKSKDWKRSDAIRDQLKELGIDVHDSKLK